MSQTQHFTEEEKVRLSEARSRYKNARKQASSEIYGSEEYWKQSKIELTTQRDIEDIQWSGLERASDTNDDYYHKARDKYLARRMELKWEYDSAVRREQRHKKRTTLLSLVKTNDLVSSRAAYVEFFMNKIRKTSRQGQGNLTINLKSTYGARTTSVGVKEVWSPVVEGGWIPQGVVKAAHIVPLSVGQNPMNYIFGKDSDKEINSARNGLWLPGLFEEQFDKLKVVIVPTGQSRQWQVLVVDKARIWNSTAYWKDGGKEVKKITFGDLHGAKLIFQNDAQPRARYFYFHYLCAMLNRSEKMKEKRLAMNEQETAGMRELSRAWGSEGSYLRENVILGFIERLGDSVDEEGAEMIRSHSGGSVAPNEVENLGSSIADMDLESDEDEEMDHDE